MLKLLFIILLSIVAQVDIEISTFSRVLRDRTHILRDQSFKGSRFRMYFRIGSVVQTINEEGYFDFNLSSTKRHSGQLIRFEPNKVIIASKHSLETSGSEGECVLFDFDVSIGTKWVVPIDKSIFLSNAQVTFDGTIDKECVGEKVYIYSVCESIVASHTPTINRIYVSRNFGVLCIELVYNKYPNDDLVTLNLVNHSLSKCSF